MRIPLGPCELGGRLHLWQQRGQRRLGPSLHCECPANWGRQIPLGPPDRLASTVFPPG
jgi:hypothetical protein